MNSIERLYQHLAGARSAVVFTGAGMSTESGLADFRSPGGIWATNTPVMYDEFLASPDARVRYWEMRSKLYPEFAKARPNVGHHAIVRLERLGKVAVIITQNIDGLHQDAGSSRVIELHGTARKVACVQCGRDHDPKEIMARIEAGDPAPNCDDCGGPLKSKTISFGQPMPEVELAEAAEATRAADIFLAIGSSLVVEPAASFPRMAAAYGATLIIINKTETPLDDLADLIIREPIGGVLANIVSRFDA